MATSVTALEPKLVWQVFAELSAVPRPSKREEQIRAHTRRWAEQHKFPYREDRVGNIVISVPASPGCEKAHITVLQGHLDMVCEKNAGTQHDFDRDPIRLLVETDAEGRQFVRADGTTLGADNGIGLAFGMAAALSPDVKHGPLELLCTIDEEMGMTGAKVLEPTSIKGRRMLNLDSEEDDAVYIGCAGGMDTTLTWQFPTAAVPAGAEVARVTVSGLRGGHSGGDIHKNHPSAIKVLVYALHGAADKGLQLAELTGGSKRNVIPREASVIIAGQPGLIAALTKGAEIAQDTAIRHRGEKTCTVRVEKATAKVVASAPDTRRVLTALTAMPHGVLAVVPEIPGLVETSNSTSTIATTQENGKLRIVVGCLSRSSLRPALHAVVRKLAAVGELAGAMVESGNEYPGWSPNISSPILATCRSVYERLFNEPPRVAAIHAGLECGIIGERIGEGQMDMVSFGPHITGAHSPDERVYVASVQKSWKFLTAVLAELAKG